MKTLNTETAFKVPEWFAKMPKEKQREYLKEHPNSKLAKHFGLGTSDKKKEKPVKENPFNVDKPKQKKKEEEKPEMPEQLPGKNAVDILKKEGSPTNFSGPKSKKDSHSDHPEKERQVVTLLKKLADLAADAKKKGEKAPNYDLCQVSIPGTNLFCDKNKGIKRQDMPQLKGVPVPGSWADKNLDKDSKGEVDAEGAFKNMLKEEGIKTTLKKVDAAKLHATQKELVGVKVAGMLEALKKDPQHEGITAPIYVSKDGYVLDGHHRWAALVGLSMADGLPNPVKMEVVEVDLGIDELVKMTNDFAEEIGIAQKKAEARLKAEAKLVVLASNDCSCGCGNCKEAKASVGDENIESPTVSKSPAKDSQLKEHLEYYRVKESMERILGFKLENFDSVFGKKEKEHFGVNSQGHSDRLVCYQYALTGSPKRSFNLEDFVRITFENDIEDTMRSMGFTLESFGKAENFMHGVEVEKTKCIETGYYISEEKDYCCVSAIGYNEENVRLEVYFSIRNSRKKLGGFFIKLNFALDYCEQYL